MDLRQLKVRVEQERGKFNQLKLERDKVLEELSTLEQHLEHVEYSRILVQEVSRETQSQIEYYISDIVSLAFASVYENPYTLHTEFVSKRGKTECELSFVRDGKKIRPLDASGGGAVDIASFALRLSLWSLNKNRPVIVLDEPFKHVSLDLQGKAMEMVRQVSRKLGLQIIMVSHSREFIEGADKVIEIRNKEGVSYIK